MKGSARIVFTIDHSNHTTEGFLDLLNQNEVTALADVRSVPYSRFSPQFNKKQISTSLNSAGIKYVYLGTELGERSEDLSCYENGHICYDRLASSPKFRDGLQRILRGSKEYRIALMCAEKDPLQCHRTLLVGHEFDKLGVPVTHILADGQLEPHAKTMTRLLSEFNLDSGSDLFNQDTSQSELIEEAIKYQSQQVSHFIEPTVSEIGQDR